MRRELLPSATFFFVGSLVLASALARGQVHENWVQTYDVAPTLQHDVSATAVAPSGNVYVAANYFSASQSEEPLLLKYASDGSLLWSRTYTDYHAYSYGVAIDPSDESAYVFGQKPHYTAYDSNFGIVLKYDANGNLLWTRLFQFHAEFPFDAAYFRSGRLAANGDLVLGAASPRGLAVVRYDTNGILQWQTQVPGFEYPQAIELDPFGDIVVPALRGGDGAPFHFGVVKVSATGSLLWTRVVTGGGAGDEYAQAATTDSAGSIYAVGYLSDPVTAQNGALVKLDSDGNVLWTRLTHGAATGNNFPAYLYAVTIAPNGNVLAGGDVHGAAEYYVRALSYTPHGEQVWVSDWSLGQLNYAYFMSMKARPDGSLTALARIQNYHGQNELGVVEWDSRGQFQFASVDLVPSGASLLDVGTFGEGGIIVFAGKTADALPKTCVAYERQQALAFCFGDGSNGACPCGNQASPGHGNGCVNSIGAAARLASIGGPLLANDTLLLTSAGEVGGAASIFLQGSSATTPSAFGDGLLCVGQSLKRLYVHAAQGGSVTAPQAGELGVSAQSAAQGDAILPGSTRYYQVYYRDDAASFCPPPAGSTWNVSSGLAIAWY
jgi:hypothetical protein